MSLANNINSKKIFEGGNNHWIGKDIESMEGNIYLHPEEVLPLIKR